MTSISCESTRVYITPISLLETVPIAFREAWARANTAVYTYIKSHDAGTPEHNAGLYWELLLLLHKVLLRKPTRSSRGRDRKKPHDNLQARFNLFEIGDYTALIRALERQCFAYVKRRRRRQDIDTNLVIKHAQRLMAVGQFSKANSTLLTHGLADLDDPRVQHQMCSKHVPRHSRLSGVLPPDLPTEDLAVKLRHKYK